MPQHTTELSTSTRVRLIPPKAEDDEAIVRLRTLPETLRYLRFLPKTCTVDDIRVRRESRAENTQIVDFHIFVKNDEEPPTLGGSTGIFNVDEINRSCEVGIVVSPQFYRGGIGTEALYNVLKYAFEARKLHRATFETGADNMPMRSWLENVLQAKLEGKRRDCWKDGENGYSDVHSYSILEGEWLGGIKQRLEKLVLRSI